MDAADRLDRLIAVTENLTAVVAGLDALDTRRGEDIDELREEVAALGAQVDAMQRFLRHAPDDWGVRA